MSAGSDCVLMEVANSYGEISDDYSESDPGPITVPHMVMHAAMPPPHHQLLLVKRPPAILHYRHKPFTSSVEAH